MGIQNKLLAACSIGDILKVQKLLKSTFFRKGADVNKPEGYSPIIVSIRNQHLEIAKLLISEGAKLNIENTYCIESFEIALEQKNIKMVEFLLSYGINVNNKCTSRLKYEKGETLFEKMLFDKKPELAEMLLSHGAKIETTGKKAFEIIHYALYKEYYGIVKLLIRSGIDVNIKDEYNHSLFYWEVREGREQGVKFLLSMGANIITEDLNSFLSHAVKNWHVGILKILIENGADINFKTDDGQSLIEIASERDYPYLAELLISKGVDVNCRNKNGKTPLLIAVEKKNNRVIETLILNGADINIEVGLDKSLIIEAIWSSWSNVVGALISAGINVNSEVKNGSTALAYAAGWGRTKVVEILISCGADVNLENEYQETPLFRAMIDNGNLKIVNLLVSAGAKIDSCNENKTTPLMLAAKRGSIEIVEFLVANGANVNAKNNNDFTPLHYACLKTEAEIIKEILDEEITEENYAYHRRDTEGPEYDKELSKRLGSADINARKNKIAIVELLIKNGANIIAKDKDGQTPYQLAVKNHQYEISKFLENYDKMLDKKLI